MPGALAIVSCALTWDFEIPLVVSVPVGVGIACEVLANQPPNEAARSVQHLACGIRAADRTFPRRNPPNPQLLDN